MGDFVNIPIIDGGPDFITTPVLFQLPPGYPPKEKQGRIYISTQGDFWDMIAIKVYGAKRGNEHLMSRLLEANYVLRDLCEFPAGVAVNVPAADVQIDIPLVPWTKATFIPSP